MPRSAWACGQRDVHDGRVEHDHQLGERDDGEREPAPRVRWWGVRFDGVGRHTCGVSHRWSPRSLVARWCQGGGRVQGGQNEAIRLSGRWPEVGRETRCGSANRNRPAPRSQPARTRRRGCPHRTRGRRDAGNCPVPGGAARSPGYSRSAVGADLMDDGEVAAVAGVATMAHPPVSAQAQRRRTFAVISHPDAGKSTLTEALALHADAITRPARSTARPAAAARCRTGWRWSRRAASPSARRRCSSRYRDRVINLLDTPGHADFSEDTYRVLTAVDCAVMLSTPPRASSRRR